MKRNQVFVRAWAQVSDRRTIVNCDVLDLTQESFNIFVTGILFKAGVLTGIKDEFVEGEHVELEVKPELAQEYIDDKDKE